MSSRFAVLIGALLSSSALAGTDASVEIRNDSAWEIHQIYISSVDTEEWGPDQLGANVIGAGGDTYTLTDIPCGAYDVQLIDEDGDECIIGDVALCAAKGQWVITDEDLLACQAATD
jgi:hypothetical protein